MPEPMANGDQADGLRKLLRPAMLRILPIIGGRDSSLRVSVTLNLAAAATLEGYNVVVLDQSRGDVAKALGVNPRYELIHLLDGERQFSDVAVAAPGGLRVLAGARGMAALAERNGYGPSLFAAFTMLERPANLVLVNMDDPLLAATLMPGTEGEMFLTTCASPGSITGAYALIKQLSRQRDLHRYRLLVCDVPGHADAQSIARNIDSVARQFLSARLTYAGCIPRDPNLGQAGRRCDPVVRKAPNSGAAIAYRRIAAEIAGWNSFSINAARPGRIQANAAIS